MYIIFRPTLFVVAKDGNKLNVYQLENGMNKIWYKVQSGAVAEGCKVSVMNENIHSSMGARRIFLG